MPRQEAAERDGDETAEADTDESSPSESAQIWEHVKALRRRVAGFN